MKDILLNLKKARKFNLRFYLYNFVPFIHLCLIKVIVVILFVRKFCCVMMNCAKARNLCDSKIIIEEV